MSDAPDVFGLVSADIDQLVDALDDAHGAETVAGVSRAGQVAELIVAESVRLVRLGTLSEVADGAVQLARLSTGRRGQRLREEHPGVHLRVRAAALILQAACSASSRASELMVLRSWQGQARAALAAVASAPQQTLSFDQLSEHLSLDAETLSRVLCDLQEAALVVLVRQGDETLVHLGPRAQQPHVHELLSVAKVAA